jgi:hypothetical protein
MEVCMTRLAILLSTAALALPIACADPWSTGGALAQALHVEDGGPHDEDACADGKCFVCHVPPGNPANAHTIHVGEAAVDAHLKHGDALGACGDDVDADTDSDSDSESDSDSDSDETPVFDGGVPLDDGDGDDGDDDEIVDAGEADAGCPDAGFPDAE